MNPDKLPVQLPPEPEPPKGLQALLKHRFFLAILVILLFFGLLFSLRLFEKTKTATAPSHLEKLTGAIPPEPAKAPASKPYRATVPKPSQPLDSETSAAKDSEPAKPEKSSLPKEAAHPEKLEPTAKELPSLTPAPPPHQAAPSKKPKGATFTQALINIIDGQVNKSLIGWRPNSILFGKLGLTDDVNQLQLGVLEVARRTIIVLNENMTRFAVTEAYNPRVNEAMNFLMVSPDKYWFPSASGKYQEALQDLETYIEDLRLGRSHFYTRVDNIIALFGHYKDILGSCYHNLIKDTEADHSSVSWFKADDYFYFSKGVALALVEMLEAVKKDFHPELRKKNTHKLLEDAIHALHEASHLSPWVITNGTKDGIFANHRANMSGYIGEAEHLVATMQTVLATN
jgi:hypothetical protein